MAAEVRFGVACVSGRKRKFASAKANRFLDGIDEYKSKAYLGFGWSNASTLFPHFRLFTPKVITNKYGYPLPPPPYLLESQSYRLKRSKSLSLKDL